MTATEVKAILNETSTTYDTYFATIVPLLQEYVCDYCNNDELGAGMKVAVAQLARLDISSGSAAGIQSEKLGDYSITYGAVSGTSADWPAEIKSLLRPYKRVVFV